MACYSVRASPLAFNHSLPPWLEDFLSLISAPRSAEDVITWKERTLILLRKMKSTPAELAVFEQWHFLPKKAIRTICGPLDTESLMVHEILIPITMEHKGEKVDCHVCPYVPRHQEYYQTTTYCSSILFVVECSLVDIAARLFTSMCYVDNERQPNFNFTDHCLIIHNGQGLVQLTDFKVWHPSSVDRTPTTVVEVCLENDAPEFTKFAHIADSILMVLRATRSTILVPLPTCEFWAKDAKNEPLISINEFLENPEIIDFDYDRVHGGQFWKEFHEYYQNDLKMAKESH